MSTVEESSQGKSQLSTGLADAIVQLSEQTILFTLYAQVILPIDGYIYWVNAALLTDTALIDAASYGSALYDKLGSSIPKTLEAKGALHYSSEVMQMEDRNITVNSMVFTATQEIQNLNLDSPVLMYVATINGIPFAFSRRDPYFKQADLYHYRGHALYSVMNTQLVDNINQINLGAPIVSNSLPIWLSLNQYFPVYPSFLSRLNLTPPYATAHIDPETTEALQAFPLVDANSNPHQLVKERVKMTVYGTANNEALNFAQYVFQYSLNTDNIGIMNMPVPRDEKLTQREMGIIAQKKSFIFEISYYQTTVNNIARKLIESAMCSFIVNPL